MKLSLGFTFQHWAVKMFFFLHIIYTVIETGSFEFKNKAEQLFQCVLWGNNGTCSAHLSTFWFASTSPPLTWVVADFHSIVPGLLHSAILFPVQNRKSCLQLFPGLWTKELLQPRTRMHTHAHTHLRAHTKETHPHSLCFPSAWVLDAPLRCEDDPQGC